MGQLKLGQFAEEFIFFTVLEGAAPKLVTPGFGSGSQYLGK
jgi:hypothetical protein